MCSICDGHALEVWHRCLPHFLALCVDVKLNDWLKDAIDKDNIIVTIIIWKI